MANQQQLQFTSKFRNTINRWAEVPVEYYQEQHENLPWNTNNLLQVMMIREKCNEESMIIIYIKQDSSELDEFVNDAAPLSSSSTALYESSSSSFHADFSSKAQQSSSSSSSSQVLKPQKQIKTLFEYHNNG